MSAVRSGDNNGVQPTRGRQRGEERVGQKRPPAASAPAQPSTASSSLGLSSGPGSNDADAVNKRIIGVPSGPKRATRASTGAPIALTAKGSLYKANKDTGTSSEEEVDRPSPLSYSRGSSNASSSRPGPVSRSTGHASGGAVGVSRSRCSGVSGSESASRSRTGSLSGSSIGGGRGGGGIRTAGGGGGRGSRGSQSAAPAPASVERVAVLSTVAALPTIAISSTVAASSRPALPAGGTGGARGGVGGVATTAGAGAEGGGQDGALDAPTAPRRRRGRKGRSIYRGVCVTREGKWRAVIYKERKQLYLGVYESELEAAKAHDRAARFHFPDKSMTNFATEAEADMLISEQEEQRRLQMEASRDLAPLRSLGREGGGSIDGGISSLRRRGSVGGHYMQVVSDWRSSEYDGSRQPSPGGGGRAGRRLSVGDVPPPRGPTLAAAYVGKGASARMIAEKAYGSWRGNNDMGGEGESDEYRDGRNGEGSYIRRRGLEDVVGDPAAVAVGGAASLGGGWGRGDQTPAGAIPGSDGRGGGGKVYGGGNQDPKWSAKYYEGDYRTPWGGGGGRGVGGSGREQHGERRWSEASARGRGGEEEAPNPAVAGGRGRGGSYREGWDDDGHAGRGESRVGGYEFFYARFPEYRRGRESGAWPRYDGGDGAGWCERGGEGGRAAKERDLEAWQQQQQQQQPPRSVAGVSPREDVQTGGLRRPPGFREAAVGHRYGAELASRDRGGGGVDWEGGGREGFKQEETGARKGDEQDEEDIGDCHDVRPTFAQLGHGHGHDGAGGEAGGGGGVEARAGEERRPMEVKPKKEEPSSDQLAVTAAGFALAHRFGLRDDRGDGCGAEPSRRGGFGWDGNGCGNASSATTTGPKYDCRGQGGGRGDVGRSGGAGGVNSVPQAKCHGREKDQSHSTAWSRREWPDVETAADAAVFAATMARMGPSDGLGSGGSGRVRYPSDVRNLYSGDAPERTSPPQPPRSGTYESQLPSPPHRRVEEDEKKEDKAERRWSGGKREKAEVFPEDVKHKGSSDRRRVTAEERESGAASNSPVKRRRQSYSLANYGGDGETRDARRGIRGGGGSGENPHPPPASSRSETTANGVGKESPRGDGGGDGSGGGEGRKDAHFEGRGGNGHGGANEGSGTQGGGLGRGRVACAYDDDDEGHREVAAAIASLSRVPPLGVFGGGVVRRRDEGVGGTAALAKAPAAGGRS